MVSSFSMKLYAIRFSFRCFTRLQIFIPLRAFYRLLIAITSSGFFVCIWNSNLSDFYSNVLLGGKNHSSLLLISNRRYMKWFLHLPVKLETLRFSFRCYTRWRKSLRRPLLIVNRHEIKFFLLLLLLLSEFCKKRKKNELTNSILQRILSNFRPCPSFPFITR